jgi:hypothetical protein
MKRIIISLLLTVSFLSNGHAQGSYPEYMAKILSQVKPNASADDLISSVNNFERVANSTKEEWLPNYYCALFTATAGFQQKDPAKIDEMADKADGFISKAIAVAGEENSELLTVQAMIVNLRIMADPMSRGMKMSMQSAGLLQKAKQADPTNPRPWLLEGQSKLYTPEAFGGGKQAAKPIFEKAAALFKEFKPKSEIMPNWGNEQMTGLLEQCK